MMRKVLKSDTWSLKYSSCCPKVDLEKLFCFVISLYHIIGCFDHLLLTLLVSKGFSALNSMKWLILNQVCLPYVHMPKC